MMYKKYVLAFFVMILTGYSYGRDPNPMDGKFNIGQDTITSYQWGIYGIDNSYLVKDDGTTITLLHNFGYGLTRYTGFELVLPFFLHQKSDGRISRGLSDMQALFQWHPYRTDDQLLVLKAGMQFPTGDTNANPPLGLGSFIPLFEFDALHSSEKWFASFILTAGIATTRKHKNPGTFIDYEITLGPKWPLGTPDQAEWLTFIEMNGLYNFPRTFNGMRVPNTGGFLLIVGPVISYDTNRCQYFARLQMPIADHRFGNQPKTKLFATLIFQWDI